TKEIFFTGGGSESDNWAIFGAAEIKEKEGKKHIISQQTEHHAVLHTLKVLEKRGFEVTLLPVSEDGLVSVNELEAAIRPDTALITIMAANNEIGTIQPVSEIGTIAKEKGILFHTDAVQAFGHIDVDVNKMNVDLLSVSGHKIHAAKGVGALYIRSGIKLPPFIHGGAQESGKRAGTENVAGIVGLGKAAELAVSEIGQESIRLTELRDKIIDSLLAAIPYSRLNGSREKRLPANVNISFEFIEGESILLMLDMKGICASSGSACTSGSLDPSHVLMAIGLPHEKAHGSLRISLGKFNTDEEADILIKELPPIVARLRDMSPLYQDFIQEQG
ncbi:MAG: aminotransferase class V-fold PLP-dependent enzyme, partial [Clostridiales bacterium]|nr:aminotransferase class V-fold PLP-dependent enzyme [Clostridiales bacterium]